MTINDEFRLDSHKLLFHPHRVAKWLESETVYPLYMEISPSGACNHRCTFCAKDYRGYRPGFLKLDVLLTRLSELASLGLKSVMYAGEGEPLMHRDIAEIISHTHAVGIDVALTTNGVLLEPQLSKQILPHMRWVKVSIDAGTSAGYAAIHRTDPNDFDKVFSNIESAARLIKTNGWSCTLGAQAILLPENVDEMETLAARSRDSGAKYLVIKPYSQHHKSNTACYSNIDYTPHLLLQERLERLNDADFTVIFRLNTFRKMQESNRGYDRCLALPFWSYVDSTGDVWGCSSYLGDERFLYGNIYEEKFQSIWTGNKRRNSLGFVAAELDTEGCRMNCRMDNINRYLWELTHPSKHVNFI
ncbi:MAG: radical SAM protein [Desulfuromonadales bacterium]